ncbi:hypothetical protein Lal_00027271, partial [Lupinus albus]
MVGMRKDSRVDGGVGGTCEVTKNPTQHSPSSKHFLMLLEDYGEHNNMVLEMEQVKGGSPYGAGTYAGDGSRQPTELELQQAFHHHKEAQGICI